MRRRRIQRRPAVFPGPPVMEFDAAGNYHSGLGRTRAMDTSGRRTNTRLHVDYKDNVWISSAGGPQTARAH